MKVLMIDSNIINLLFEKINKIERLLENQAFKEATDLAEFLDTNEVCRLLNISRRTFQRYRSRNKVGYLLIGRKRYYSLSDIRVFQEERYLDKNHSSPKEQ